MKQKNELKITKMATMLILVASIAAPSLLSSRALAQESASTQAPQASVVVDDDPELTKALFKHFQKRFFNRIDATSEQREKINNILESKLKLNKQNRLALKTGIKELGRLACNPKAKTSDIEAKAHELQTLRQQMSESRLKTMLEVRALLSDEQLTKLGQRLEAVLERRQKGFAS
ncbi:MAG: Spy/CpxP family protein refolding chaperone [Candidatus Obscuribacter sp.]|jgi:Spy/CpxP family protein refolding chaperone|nr:Spy/CpxP family protein refolding chaperone [Candidatus Obscuribacter sp.]MDQ5965007.1 Spy/CpxP family protein refolding chaperone [Cyanobacteriota bacterium erpe_2018_sw_39hr_WHONDRS-SW48-000098_B_bin.30]MBK7837158.1 Spy/CpxP family protein refolding chaperone [Candidatus Obscuribacter sp.]MBK9205006.1 Spy/CpxP family protein refolding chaperone [Candidatus Obscuribacter sp.]MBK9620272.1 Spy/CpxP family protein refolding chaperone [Candidatus Obscuribacter sp.]